MLGGSPSPRSSGPGSEPKFSAAFDIFVLQSIIYYKYLLYVCGGTVSGATAAVSCGGTGGTTRSSGGVKMSGEEASEYGA